MKKTIFPMSKYYICVMMLIGFFGLLFLYFFICGLIDVFTKLEAVSIIITIFCPILSGFCFYNIFNHFVNRLIITDKGILVTGQHSIKRIQHKEYINFIDIKDIVIKSAFINSKGKKVVQVYSKQSPYTFFEFKLLNNEQKRIQIDVFSTSQIKELLMIINNFTGLNFDYNNLKTND